MKLELERAPKSTKPQKEVAFYIHCDLLERWQKKVNVEEGRMSYSKVIEALMRLYLGEKLPKKQ